MELESVTNGTFEDSVFEIGGDIDVDGYENEKCGICMDIIVDRGVLDCCQHWFCFACIDNWATITNLCPLCQNEFQLITCVPVYDTIGSGKVEDDSYSRDDDWCIQGTNNTLSFPSYYIDENAVICLDGNGCKIRNGVATSEDDSILDTSIACDSCDIWYHAFCVEFDPESTSENSWLCPRCIEEVPRKSDGVSIQMPNNQCGPESASHECMDEVSFSGKLSVSVPDAGETAVVVSMIEGKHWIKEPSENFLSVQQNLDKKSDIQPYVDVEETTLALSLSQDTHFTVPCDSLPLSELKTNCADKAVSEANGSDGCKLFSELLSDESHIESEPSEIEPNVDLHLGLSLGSSLSAHKTNSEATENHVSEVPQSHNLSKESSLSVDNMDLDANEDAIGFSCLKRKSMSSRDHVLETEYTELDNICTRYELVGEAPAKKAKPDGESQHTHLKCEIRESISGDTQKCSHLPVSIEDKLRDVPEQEDISSDIMSIVRGTKQRPPDGVSRLNPADKSSMEKDNGAGLRVKKIMRRAAEDESFKLVEKLRKEIREAVRNRAAKNLNQSNFFDPKLLLAFRSAITGPRTEHEPVKRLNLSVVRAKKSILQKGKTRENLTKKIYGTSNGRRRRAWDRDWEVEFWKHRCTRMTKPEKVETLKSVLDLLRKSSEMEQEHGGDASNPILSRLYLADTSVFPRKNDIKPLSALRGTGNDEVDGEHNVNEKISRSSSDNRTVQTPKQISKNLSQELKNEASCKKVYSNGSINKQSSMSMKSASRENDQPQEEMSGKSDLKCDKRKWALEVLARKTSTVKSNATQGNQEDNTMLKGNFPLLAQLPTDMRPILAPSRHNKVPTSVRQAQLYRLTEHFLRKANVPVMRRTADTELAVADAVNIEKEVVNRSNSKLVYVNLCSQALSQHMSNNRPDGAAESDLSQSVVNAESTDPAPAPAPREPYSDLSAEAALRMAGLVSDSPPSSPYHLEKDLNDENGPSVSGDGGPDNVFDMDTHPDLDIYGDFEYDLENEDYIGGSIPKASKSQPEDGDSKLKVVFSTLNARRIDEAMDPKANETLGIVNEPTNYPCNELQKGTDIGATSEVRTDSTCPPPGPLQDEIGGEPSLAECEELYGPDKEPLVERLPIKASNDPHILIEKEALAENPSQSNKADCSPNKGVNTFGFDSESCAENIMVRKGLPADCNSSGGENSPHVNENVQRKEKKTDKSKQSDIIRSVSKKVEVYIKEHIRPLCKSGVITVEQYRWAVERTTSKIMRYHLKDTNANFLIKEGEKVKKLAEEYAVAAQKKSA